MTKKTVKDLEQEINHLKEDFKELKKNYDTLNQKYEALESGQEANSACSSCGEIFENIKNLRIHKRNVHSAMRDGTFKCDQCDKMFDVEWKLNAHQKLHKKMYPCNQCDKSFKYKETRRKHTTAVHEKIILYCHFYNNNKKCPFENNVFFCMTTLWNVNLLKIVKDLFACSSMMTLETP